MTGPRAWLARWNLFRCPHASHSRSYRVREGYVTTTCHYCRRTWRLR